MKYKVKIKTEEEIIIDDKNTPFGNPLKDKLEVERMFLQRRDEFNPMMISSKGNRTIEVEEISPS